MTWAIVLAAGAGRRFAAAAPDAGPKLLAMVHVLPMLDHTLAALREGGVTHFVVVGAPDADARLEALARAHNATWITNPSPERGMLSSVQIGLTHQPARDAAICLLHPGDIPFVAPASITAIIDAAQGGASVSPRYREHGGHPVALSRALRAMVSTARPEASLKPLLYADVPVQLPLDDPGLLRDVDVPGDL